MIRTHVLIWVCGKAIWVWRWLTLAQFNALPHVTQDMILRRVVKYAVGGAIGLCAGGGVVLTPPLLSGGGGTNGIVMPLFHHPRAAQPKPVPEPGSLIVLLTGIGGLIVIRKTKKVRNG